MSAINKAKNPSKKRVKWTLIVLTMYALWASFTVYSQWKDIDVKEERLTELQKEQEHVIANKKELEDKVKMLQDENYIADLARRYYFLSKPGEIIFISPKE